MAEQHDAKARNEAAKQNRDKRMEEDKKKLAEAKQAREKQMAETAKAMGRPTPTQEELDLIKLGHHVELSDDGSGPDPNHPPGGVHPQSGLKRHSEAEHGGAPYATRQSTASSHATTRQRAE